MTVLGLSWYATPARGAKFFQFIVWIPWDDTPPTPKTYMLPSLRFNVAPLPAAFTDSGNTISQRRPRVMVHFGVGRHSSWPYQKKRGWCSDAFVLLLT